MASLVIYIAGPISACTTDFRANFAEAKLEVATMGHLPVSPVEVVAAAHVIEGDWLACIKADIRALLESDGIYCLRDWHQSRGARIEHFIATSLGMVVLYQPEKEN